MNWQRDVALRTVKHTAIAIRNMRHIRFWRCLILDWGFLKKQCQMNWIAKGCFLVVEFQRQGILRLEMQIGRQEQ